MTYQEALKAVRSLDLDDRARLVHTVLEEMDDAQEPPELTEAEKSELLRRLAAHRAHPERAVPWEQVKARAQARFKP